MDYYINTSQELFVNLSEIPNISTNHSSHCTEAIILVSSVLQKFREKVLQSGFNSKQDEITFFKEIKPKVYAQLIYYTKLHDLERKRIIMSEDRVESYKNKIIKDFHYLFQDNYEFVQYYYGAQTVLDEYYFIRNINCIPIINNGVILSCDSEFTTTHDNIVANIIAFEYITSHFLKKKDIETDSDKSILNWTGNKSDLVELIYALKQSGLINNGNIEIKELCQNFEKMFNTELTDVYRTFHDIRSRKTNRTKLLKLMSDDLNNYLNDFD